MSTPFSLLGDSFLIRCKDYLKWPFVAEGYLPEDNGISNRLCSYEVGPALAGHSSTPYLRRTYTQGSLKLLRATEKTVWLLVQIGN